ncbi:NAD(P)-dependent dehydrogenase, short-chain alcohol dehydrogenase family [Pseudomonas sp. NFPP10]|uniref:SDR family NAD(P)-dependent oxidoreductase n=1 Tax=unclassified Pseudomonas TaxID=196821 RepID=UPI000883E4F6|nr:MULTISPECIES: SDR family NAD(P)-dependent oxidoreductase [unclassified Pseudomonas]SDA34841.1 NAD(P)-dependent dehydrogenase, short-chain alcohol dehydrogenase family [Pseudomonas sp. NFPP12]SEM67458.1 NAD(P)-dependent dehydrogenase, short-chain alcohol dehydrogenase family [Pseudomonas sp. NFPP10]SFK28499.1 NAD(P)-dependent dehydrogenase, short-chain alcohol dehydrogenase family [Pseudomonas sp. NFPP08]SFN73758.1 NAD(P)-dependent dehydrogenase, short-chain alcohol dehydrogenase family [Pseu
MKSKQPQVALVTGASRGVGRGIALALGAQGMTVYVTGRAPEKAGARLYEQALQGSLADTAAAITAAGGRGIPVVCEHADDAQVQALFARIAEEAGHLDLLVNNVAAIHERLIEPGPFWNKPLELVDILDVGLRSAYIASYYAAPLLLRSAQGLVCFTSSFGAGCYMHGPAYGAQKAGCDKLAADMAIDFEGRGVAALSLWLGPQLTERTRIVGEHHGEQYQAFLADAETPQFNGRVIHALLNDPGLMSLSGQTLITAEIAPGYGISEDQGRQPPSHRSLLGEPRRQHPARVI